MTAVAVAPTLRTRRRLPPPGILAVLGLGLGVLTTSFKISNGTHPWWDVALTSTSAYLFVVVGWIATRRPGGSRVGGLMIVVGIALFAEDIQLSADPVVHTIGMALRAASAAPLAHLMLSFPSGVLQGRAASIVVGAAYCWSFVLMPLAVPFQHTEVPNLVQVTDLTWVTDAVGTLGLPIAVATLVVLLHRWYAMRPQLRYVLTPVVAVNLMIAVATLGAAVSWAGELGLYRAFIISYQIGACLLPLAFLVGVLRIRLGRSAVSRLVTDLSEPVGPERLQTLLSRTLGDPDLLVGYRRTDGSGLVDGRGRPLPPTSSTGPQVLTPVVHDGRTVGALRHNRALLDDDHVLRAATAAAGIALENQRLNAELMAQLAEVRESRARLVVAEQQERARVERDLHDGVQAKLVAAFISVRHAAAEQSSSPAATRTALARATVGLQEALDDLRRIAHGIRPAVLSEAGLEPALRALLDGSGLVSTLRVAGPEVEDALEVTTYFVVAEAVSNTVKYARAARVDVAVERRPGRIRVSVRDDGVGGAALRRSGGLHGLEDRVHALDGTLRIQSGPGRGTTLTAELGPGR